MEETQRGDGYPQTREEGTGTDPGGTQPSDTLVLDI